MINTISKKVSHYQIDSFEDNNQLLVKVYNLNAKKVWNRQIGYFSFKTEEARKHYIEDLITSYSDWETRKAQHRAERQNLVNTYKIGDIFYNSWGYDQTNIDFFEVVKISAKKVWIREIKGKLTQYTGNGMAGFTIARPGEYASEKVYIASIGFYGLTAKLDHSRTQYLSKWDGKELYCSWYA